MAMNPSFDSRGVPAGLQRWLKLDSEKKPRLYAELYGAADMSRLNYWL
jgi:hypothetical protein